MNRGGRGIAQAMMIAVAFMTVFPLYFILITAFKTRKEYLTNEFLPPSHLAGASHSAAGWVSQSSPGHSEELPFSGHSFERGLVVRSRL